MLGSDLLLENPCRKQFKAICVLHLFQRNKVDVKRTVGIEATNIFLEQLSFPNFDFKCLVCLDLAWQRHRMGFSINLMGSSIQTQACQRLCAPWICVRVWKSVKVAQVFF